MARWDPDAGDRLQKAAVRLYLERGFEEVTVAEIAQSVGLTRRTFFRHFADKREVLFVHAGALEADVVAGIVAAGDDVPPIEAVAAALADAGAGLARHGDVDFGRALRDLVSSSADLQERERTKTAALGPAIRQALQDRGVDDLQAGLTSAAGIAVFTTAYDRWMDGASTDFHVLVRQSLETLRHVVVEHAPSPPAPRRG